MERQLSEEVLENHKKFAERLTIYKTFGYDFEKEREFVLQSALPIKGKILEVGTGKGHFSIALARAGFKFTSIDISQEEQQIALLNLKYFGLENLVELKIENAEKLSFPNNYFDTIVSVNLIHHLQNPYKVIDEIVRVTSPNGKIVISDFSPKGFEIIQKIHESEGRVHEKNDITIKDIEKYLLQKGFIVRETASYMQEILTITFKINTQFN